MDEVEAVKMAEKVIELLKDRKGFDYWWEDIYSVDRRRIVTDIAELLRSGELT